MTKTTKTIEFNYYYNEKRNRSHYTLDGVKYMNGGEFAEVCAKYVRGYEMTKDANTPFDKGSDIEETHTSVKSDGCGLTDRHLANNKEEFLLEYFKHTASTNVDYVIIEDDEIKVYNMNMTEFKEFTSMFAKWDKASVKVRIHTTKTMKRWLEMRVA